MDDPHTLSKIALGAAWYAVFLFSLTVHEAAHAFVAWKFGDPTAYLGGQVSLNPLPHVRRAPVGTVVVPIASFLLSGFMIGWANAPYDPVWAERHPRREVLMALAGPAANLVLVVAAGLAVRAGMLAGLLAAPGRITLERVTESAAGGGPTVEAAVTVLSILFSLNLILFAFNLLPLPPLDGSAVIPLFLTPSAALHYKDFLATTPALSLVGLVIAWKLFPPLFGPLHVLALNLLYPGMGYG